MMKSFSLHLVALIPMLAFPAMADSLDAYVGLKRLIIVSSPTVAESERINASFVKQRMQLEERDLTIIDVSENPHQINAALRLPSERTATVRNEFKLKSGETRAVFILIGKDGGEKARCYEVLNLEKWFALIDQMPMRKAEILGQ
jgi:hypothetical protein